MKLISIELNSTAPTEFCEEIHKQTLDYYKIIGYTEPWVSYYLKDENEIVGICSFKGCPDTKHKVEIAYYTFELFQSKGYGSKMCKLLIDIAKLHEDVSVFARTLPQTNASTAILTKNGFKCVGTVLDPGDGELWEWSLV